MKPVKKPAQTTDGGQIRFAAGIQHSEDTIHCLYRTAYQTYHQLSILTQLGLGMVMVLLAVTMPGWHTALRGILAAVGCWLLVSRDFISANRAEDALEKRGGSLPDMQYAFYDRSFQLSGEGSMRLKYASLQRLVEDDAYLYLFQNAHSVCMIDRATVTPDGAEALKAFLAEKTGQTWLRNRSLFSMNLSDLLRAVKDRREQVRERRSGRSK